jgi:hypothetical protein
MCEPLKFELEQHVDKVGLSSVLNILAEICHEKAGHLQSAWQDSVAAKSWTKDGKLIEKVVSKLNN